MNKTSKLVKLGIWLLATFLFCILLANFHKGFSLSPRQSTYTHQEIISELVKADIVYLGETHDSLKDHEIQLEIIQALYQQNSKIAIALEMFQRPYQEALDRYIAKEISEIELREQTGIRTTLGF